ncbi:hypothetical protein ABB37_01303 [Leptomonas pyrrhocoris]|uniref:Uncharacterized protein n=1 Tax=Leptomonas pyrrhocoris TaxID=157538 RepID=A0A0M9G8B9_LEPPY|nr:hypothetical protein ABB37_01303 [Leptomonas pyrrhocoris]KPA84830.1 hypothetical protein ABB37_01303 [Leptomonas pyrrhocoris]|eukprot:XP_015663269.1 hypothetical protein ABB37_01303 [Leptomonas pyrrhocoris]
MMRSVLFTVSFDALETLIQITNGVGYQYRTAFSTFLKQRGIDLDAACPNASCDNVNDVALKAIRDEMKVDRATWTTTDNPKEQPIGGDSDETLVKFWGNVFARTFKNPLLYEGASPDVAEQITSLWTAEAEAMQKFMHYVIFDLFKSTKTQSWLPEGLRTLQSLRAWNLTRVQLAQQSTANASAASSSAPMLMLAAPPFVVSNMDPRLRTVFSQLGAFAPGEHGEPPLLSRVIVARDIGLAKPSPLGLLTGVRDIAAARRAEGCPGEVEMRYHVHIGDAEADRIACEKAGCTYLQCDPTIGATWEQLRSKLEEIESSLRN